MYINPALKNIFAVDVLYLVKLTDAKFESVGWENINNSVEKIIVK